MNRLAAPVLIVMALILAFAWPAAAAADTVASGNWTRKNYDIRGTWSIVQEGEYYFVELDRNFRTRNAPDLKIFITADSARSLGDRNAIRNAELVAPLRSNSGAQRYRVPADAASLLASGAQTILIHCERYSKLWGVGTIDPDV